MDVSLDELIAGQKKAGRAQRGRQVPSKVTGVKKDPIKPANKKSATIGTKRRGGPISPSRKVAVNSNSGRGPNSQLSIGAPIVVSRRLLARASSKSGGAISGTLPQQQQSSARRSARARSLGRSVHSDVSARVVVENRQFAAHELSEQERLKATNIKIITELDNVPTPGGPLRKFVEESNSTPHSARSSSAHQRKYQQQTTRLADRFR